MAIKLRPAQALMELAVGLFTLALVISAFAAFSFYINRSLEIQNHLRGNAKIVSDKLEVGKEADAMAVKEIFGRERIEIKEPNGIVDRNIY